MAKTDWSSNDVVLPSHLNQIGEEINAAAVAASAAETPAGAQAKADAIAGIIQDALDDHAASSDVHGATAEATVLALVKRDANGRFKATAPAASDDVARKAETDALAEEIDNRLQNNLTLRYSEDGVVQSWNGEEWIAVGGDPTLSNFFGQYGVFPFAGLSDITISTNTTWGDNETFMRAKTLTINPGVTLFISRSPFYIFCDELIGDVSSIIDASGLDGSAGPTVFPINCTAGGGRSAGENQGGGGGKMLFIVCKTLNFKGIIKSNGGNAFGGANSSSRGGQGALSNARNLSSNNAAIDWQGTSVGGSTITYSHLHSFGLPLVTGGGSSSFMGKFGSSGIGGALETTSAGGGSGIGGGGGNNGSTPSPGASSSLQSLATLHTLASIGCLGGGAGGTSQAAGTASGGAAGSVVVYFRDLIENPTLEADGGIGVGNGGDGGAGVTYLIAV